MSKFTKKNKEHLDSMVIGQGHTIMAGYIPEALLADRTLHLWKDTVFFSRKHYYRHSSYSHPSGFEAQKDELERSTR